MGKRKLKSHHLAFSRARRKQTRKPEECLRYIAWEHQSSWTFCRFSSSFFSSSSFFFLEIIMSNLPRKLVETSTSHCNINTEKVPVFRSNHSAVARPDDSCAGNRYLLWIREFLWWFSKVSNIGNTNAPLESWCPKVNCNDRRSLFSEQAKDLLWQQEGLNII